MYIFLSHSHQSPTVDCLKVKHFIYECLTCTEDKQASNLENSDFMKF